MIQSVCKCKIVCVHKCDYEMQVKMIFFAICIRWSYIKKTKQTNKNQTLNVYNQKIHTKKHTNKKTH